MKESEITNKINTTIPKVKRNSSFVLTPNICETSNIFRAYAPVAGTIFPNGLSNNICTPSFPVPIFETHGRNDNVTEIEGDYNNSGGWGVYLSIDTIIDFWVGQNALTNLVIDTFPNFNNTNKITISYKYSAPNSNNEVWISS